MNKRKRAYRVAFSCIFVTAVSVLALYLMCLEYRSYRQEILQSQDAQLFTVVDAVDRSLDIYLDQYCTSLRYVLRRSGFAEAEQVFLQTGDVTDLFAQMRSSLIVQDTMALSLIAMDQTGAPLLASGPADFEPLNGSLERGGVQIRLCRDAAGRYGLAFVTDGADGRLDYALILDLQALYLRISGSSTYDRIVLLDKNQQVLIRTNSCGKTSMVDVAGGRVQDPQDLAFLQQMRNATVETASETRMATFFEVPACASQPGYLARMAVYEPRQLDNDFFTVCVTMDYEKIATAMRRNTLRISLCAALVMGAFLHLMGKLLRTDHRCRRAEQAVLQQRNEILTDIRRQEQELSHHQRLQTIGTLTSGVAHEFNNLLTPIMGYSLMALEEVADEQSELYDDLLEIYQAACKSKEIVARISSLSGKHMDLTFKPLSLDRVVESVCTVLLPSKQANVELRKELGCGPCRVNGSETHLSQVILNLCINALHAMEDHGGVLTLRTRVVRDETGRWAQLLVTDTGVGIPSADIERVFEPFYTTKPAGKGSGLGLPIVRQILDEHGGTVTMCSLPGVGTTVTVRLPVPTDSAPEEQRDLAEE